MRLQKSTCECFLTYERHIFKFEFLFYASLLSEAHKETVHQRHIFKFEFLF